MKKIISYIGNLCDFVYYYVSYLLFVYLMFLAFYNFYACYSFPNTVHTEIRNCRSDASTLTTKYLLSTKKEGSTFLAEPSSTYYL